jgi:NitT/TauT family transport system permease protein
MTRVATVTDDGVTVARAGGRTVRRRRERSVIASPAVVRALALLAGAVIWEVYGRQRGSTFTIPPLSDVLAAVPGMVSSSEYWGAVGTTVTATLLGLAIILPCGYLIGVTAGLSHRAGRFIQPYMTICLATPMIAVIPVVVLTFGLGLIARLVTVALFALPYLAVNVAAGYRETPGDLVSMSRSFGQSRTRIFFKVETMAALPAVFAGVRLAVARAFVGVIVAELLILSTGLGRLLTNTTARFRNQEMFVVVLTCVGIAFALLRTVGYAERRVLEGNGIVRK